MQGLGIFLVEVGCIYLARIQSKQHVQYFQPMRKKLLGCSYHVLLNCSERKVSKGDLGLHLTEQCQGCCMLLGIAQRWKAVRGNKKYPLKCIDVDRFVCVTAHTFFFLLPNWAEFQRQWKSEIDSTCYSQALFPEHQHILKQLRRTATAAAFLSEITAL